MNDTQKYLDKITLQYLAGNKFNNNNNQDINKDDIAFYKKRIINTTRELITKFIDSSLNISNNIIDNTFIDYINLLIYSYKQSDLTELIEKHNGFQRNIDNNDNDNNDNNDNDNDNILDISNNKLDSIFIKSLKTKNNTYNWRDFCIINKKAEHDNINLPKLANYDLKEPSLRIKGVKQKNKNKK